MSCVVTPAAKAKVEKAVAHVRETARAFGGTGATRMPSPYEQGLDFIVPLLCVREGEALFEFESTFLLERPWQLSVKDASLSSGYNPLVRPAGRAGVLDVGTKGEVQTNLLPKAAAADFVSSLHQQMLALGASGGWSVEALVAWLDRHIDHQDISVGESAAFLQKVIRGLMARFDCADVNVLALDRFRLREEVEARIQQHRDRERETAFQAYLLPESVLVVDEQRAINFGTMMYEPSWVYEGSFQFNKHYFGPKPGELDDFTANGGIREEFACALFLDALAEVKFWVRNLARKQTSFRLQTSKDWFYPDFVCQLGDGRVLVVEYKGGHLWADAEEKRAVGAVWASRSAGRCLFVMPTDGDFSEISKILSAV